MVQTSFSFEARMTVCVRHVQSSRRSSHIVRVQNSDFAADVKRFAKKIQGSLPVIGLISRLTAPAGGFDELTYPEFARGILERAPEGFAIAVEDLEKKYGKAASRRYVLFCCWLAEVGTGFVPAQSLLSAARRIRVTEDLAVECERFEANKAEEAKKYQFITRPDAALKDKIAVAMDCLCRCALAVEDGKPVPAEAKPLLSVVLRGAFGAGVDITDGMLEEVYSGREQRGVGLKN